MWYGTLLLMIFLGSVQAAWAELYRCPDGKGGSVIKDEPCSGSQAPKSLPAAIQPPAPEPLQPVCQEKAPGISAGNRDQAMASESFKALRKISAATEVEISFRDYGPLVVDAKAAVNDAIPNISDNELKKELEEAMQAYADALTA